jgi:hypothetical protein
VNTWTHLAATYDGAVLRLYVNGTLAGSLSRAGSIDASAGPLRIGGNSLWGEWFNGRIDEVRVYNRALSQGEIQTDMNTPVGSPERLLGEPAAGGAPPLGLQEVRPLFDEAVARWSVALGDPAAVERLQAVRVEILNLPGATLGLASGAVVFLDADGAGHGWFIDPTPWDDSEFAPARAGGPAAGRADLLTVMAHELGHILGLDDDPEADPFTGTVMAAVLPLGVRRVHLEGLVPGAPVPGATPPLPDAVPVPAAPARVAVRVVAPPADPGPGGGPLSRVGLVAPPDPAGPVGIVFPAVPGTLSTGTASVHRDSGEADSAVGGGASVACPPAARLEDEPVGQDGPFVGIGGDPLVDWEHPVDFAWGRLAGNGE